MREAKKLTNLQLELLKVFNVELNEVQLLEVRTLLSQYLAAKITSDVDALFVENGWDETIIEQWSKEHMRTKYEA